MSVTPAERSLLRSVVLKEKLREPKLKNGALRRTLSTLEVLNTDIQNDWYETRRMIGSWHERDYVIDPHEADISEQLNELIDKHGTYYVEDSSIIYAEKRQPSLDSGLIKEVNPVPILLGNGDRILLSAKQRIQTDSGYIYLTNSNNLSIPIYSVLHMSQLPVVIDRQGQQPKLQDFDFIANVITLIEDKVATNASITSLKPLTKRR